jgi:hypothetical protein
VANRLLNLFPLFASQILSLQSAGASAAPVLQPVALNAGSNQFAAGFVNEAANFVSLEPVAVNAFPSMETPANIPEITPLSIPWIPTTHGPSPAKFCS